MIINKFKKKQLFIVIVGQSIFIKKNQNANISEHFIYSLEFELQKVDSSVSLCYWDSSMDNDMERPQETAMFTSQLVRNGIGPVINGPFADWLEADGAMPLVRHIA